jgi:5-carboxymethyl-2-hydroxymuconate isomerase
MPQIIFEHSANLIGIDYTGFYSAIYQCLVKIPNIGTCKMRAISQDNYYIGAENGENAFAFLRILMAPKPERTDQFKEDVAKNLIPILCQYLDPVKKNLNIKCDPTIEVGFLSKQYYWIS